MTTNCPVATVFREPVATSRAFSGNCAHILPNSETCRYCRVPERTELETRIAELLAKDRLSALSCVAGQASLISSGSWS